MAVVVLVLCAAAVAAMLVGVHCCITAGGNSSWFMVVGWVQHAGPAELCSPGLNSFVCQHELQALFA